ncbi:ABC transporter substrate-binding protein [Paenibacillaceae bacterium WGS1546]|uniref:ABC transporter substrate-binding protein n=1 Tax=Cohnella sp. WGS1546 TaxID=3366810 RepID=UPI00372D42B8
MKLVHRLGLSLVLLICFAGLLVGCGRNGAESGEDAAATRIVDNLWGQIEVPANPQRIVLTYHDDIDHFAALGANLAGIPTYERSGNIDGYLPYLADQMQGVEKLGNAPSLEAILSAKPDLIVAGYFHREIQEQLAKIAPTLFFEWNVDWRKTHLEMGKALGLEAKAQENIDRFNAEAEKTKAYLETVIGDEPVAFIRVRQKQLDLYGSMEDGSFVSMILYNWLGLTPVEEAPKDVWGAPFSLENFAEMKAEHIFLYVHEDDDDVALAQELLTQPLYQNVPAIKNNKVYKVQSFPWDRGGPIAFTMGMEQIREIVAKP